jgi:hypothetical protein
VKPLWALQETRPRQTSGWAERGAVSGEGRRSERVSEKVSELRCMEERQDELREQ